MIASILSLCLDKAMPAPARTAEATLLVVVSFTVFVGSLCPFVFGFTNNSFLNNIYSTVFQLVKAKWNKDEKPAEKAAWYALALEDCPESIHTSHERDRSQFQESFENFALPSALCKQKANEEFYSECFASNIDVSEDAMKVRLSNAPSKKVAASATTQAMPTKSTYKAPVKKTATTAKNFFGKNNSSSTATKSKTTSNANNNNNKNNITTKKSATLSFQPKKKDVTSNNKTMKKVPEEEKENVENKNVGDADDFVGDIEDSDDEDVTMNDDAEPVEEEQEELTTKRKTKKAKKPARKVCDLGVSDEDEENAPAKTVVEGAMDAFTKKVPPKTQNNNENGNGSKRRRRKVTKDKTFVDEKGYLIVESQEVWEDIPSDEEEPVATKPKSAKPSPKKKAKKAEAPNAMKQGTIKGFFAKKK